jgi:hypothetical protein
MISLRPAPSESLAKFPPVAPYRDNALQRPNSDPFLAVRQYAAEQGVADEEAIAKGMEECKKFVEKGWRFTLEIKLSQS